MASLVLVIDVNQDKGTLDAIRFKSNLPAFVRKLASGALIGSIEAHSSAATPARASATATLATVAADDTITIAGVTLTAKASPSGENEFSQAGSDTADAAALTAKINAHSVMSKYVYATSALGVVTIYSVVKGDIGNLIAVAKTGSTITLSGAVLSGGAGGVTGTARVME